MKSYSNDIPNISTDEFKEILVKTREVRDRSELFGKEVTKSIDNIDKLKRSIVDRFDNIRKRDQKMFNVLVITMLLSLFNAGLLVTLVIRDIV